MPAKYSIHTKAAPPRFRPVGKLGIVDWREDCSNCHNCVKRSCVYGLYRDETGYVARRAGLSGLHLPVQRLPELRPELHQEHPHPRGEPRVPAPGRRVLHARHYRLHLVSGGSGPDSRFRLGLRRAFQRSRIRFHVDRHVGNRPPDARRHPRPRIHSYERGHRPQASASGLHGRAHWMLRRRPWWSALCR